MEGLAPILMIIGYGVAIVGGIMILVAAFSESVLWGIGCLLFGPVSLVFVILHWDAAKRGFLTSLAGWGIVVLGIVAAGGGGGGGPA